MPRVPAPRRVTIVGGGLFPRTALALRRLLPEATLTMVDAQPANLETARAFVDGIALRHHMFDAATADGADLVVIPLYIWQDVVIAGVFFLVDTSLKRERIGWALYAATVLYVAINVPVTRVLSTPLTWTIIRAAGGPLADSIAHYVTPPNLAVLAVPVIAGAALPWFLRRRTIAIGRRTIGIGAVVAAAGCAGVAHVDTRGLHRSAVGALVATTVPRVAAAPGTVDWRSSPYAARSRQSLTHFAGSLAWRNVVLIVLESTAARHLGVYGAPADPTPHLTALAQNAIVFDRAYSVYPESIKGLFATLCSR